MATKRRSRGRTSTKRSTGRRSRSSGKGGKRSWIWLGALGVGAYLFLRGGGGGDLVAPGMSPAAVAAGETISVEGHYRVLGSRRPGMTYDAVVQGSPPGTVTFLVSKGGTFTRNFVSENGKLFAEIA